MTQLTYRDINEDVLDGMKQPRGLYWIVVAILSGGVLMMFLNWIYQVKKGMGVAGINHPVGWATYITNFVFWVGIAHSGTLVSAILHLVRSRWRAAISRAAEAMTVFAVMTAGLFPLVHLGRLWVFYYIIPYPSQRQLWPNFISPLVWDVVAVTTYLTVSTIFWYVGLLPDLASARDRYADRLGPNHPRTKFYRAVALGWSGAASQWRHYGRSYLFFAALATPLVVSVHSVVSWDFATSLLPGWHTTIFPPYFVAGAIHSGLAMVLTLLIPLRRLLNMRRVITARHLNAIAKTLIVTTLIVGYAYIIEPFIAWYCGDPFEQQFALFRATGWMALGYWALTLLNVLFPLTLISRRARASVKWLFIVSIAITIGMWLERYVIIISSLSHDFLPHNWDQYSPRPVEVMIATGGLTFFLFFFFWFSKFIPTVAASEVKETLAQEEHHAPEAAPSPDQAMPGFAPANARGTILYPARNARTGVLAVFTQPDALVEALRTVRQSAFDRVDAFSPFRIDELIPLLTRRPSPVRYWTLVGAVTGCLGGFALAIGSAMVNNLVVGAKITPITVIPYCIIGFEGTILIGTLVNLAGMIFHMRLGGHRPLPPGYDRRFSRDRFGLFIMCDSNRFDAAREVLSATRPETIHVIK